MKYTKELENMVCVKTCSARGPAPIPQEGSFGKVTEVSGISGFSHSVGTCAMKQGACKLTTNVKNGIIQEALIEVIGCSGMTQSACMAAEILPGRTLLEALNTDLVCDAINVAMREQFLNLAYGRSQSAFTQEGLDIGVGMEDLGNGRMSMMGTSYGTVFKGPRYLHTAEGYIRRLALDDHNRIIGYEFTNLGKMMELIDAGEDPGIALEKTTGTYGRFSEAARIINPRKE
ncbi:MAG: hypothetical protein ACYCX2_03530 [Christensenellales bacterium]